MVSIDYISKLLNIACDEVGTREDGSNSGSRIREYQSCTWLKPDAWAWCAAFVCWCIREASKLSRFDLKLPTTPRAFEFIKWAKFNNLAVIYSPKCVVRGDIVIYKFPHGYHIGIVSKDSTGGMFTAVEGNTNHAGSREGDGVYFKTRNISAVFAVVSWRRCPVVRK